MKFQKILLFSLIFIAINGCSHSRKEKEIDDALEIVQLQKSRSYNNSDLDFVDVLFPAFPTNSEYKNFEINKLKDFKNIPELDSFKIVSKNLDRDLYYLDLYKNELISKEAFLENTKNVNIDSSLISEDVKQYRFNAIFGFKNMRKIIIPDWNNNFDFKDDEILSFPMDSIYSFQNSNSIKNLPNHKFKYKGIINNQLKWINRDIKVYPNQNSFYKFVVEKSVEKKSDIDYTLMILFDDTWTGKKNLNGIQYNFKVYGGLIHRYSKILIKPDSINHNQFSLDNFEYKTGDTIRISSNSFRLDSLSSNINKLYIQKLPDSTINIVGKRMGDTIRNYKLENLKGEKFDLYSTNKKKYTLIDFWGTWCKPCKELTPDLRRLYAENSNKVEIISIAADLDKADVEKYVLDQKLNWKHAYIYLKDYSIKIRKELKINTFPTFILLDDNNKILIRGNSDSFPVIEKFIKTN